ncbi:hypothetical protein BY996DRAFT_6525956 [Phakopsora pachyrhizi]|nr:hypothetical protein BY996DRAFT_6525956 [Phakopsora pachyrhizi]
MTQKDKNTPKKQSRNRQYGSMAKQLRHDSPSIHSNEPHGINCLQVTAVQIYNQEAEKVFATMKQLNKIVNLLPIVGDQEATILEALQEEVWICLRWHNHISQRVVIRMVPGLLTILMIHPDHLQQSSQFLPQLAYQNILASALSNSTQMPILKVTRSLVVAQLTLWDLRRPSNYHSIELADYYKPRRVKWDYSGQFISAFGDYLRNLTGEEKCDLFRESVYELIRFPGNLVDYREMLMEIMDGKSGQLSRSAPKILMSSAETVAAMKKLIK